MVNLVKPLSWDNWKKKSDKLFFEYNPAGDISDEEKKLQNSESYKKAQSFMKYIFELNEGKSVNNVDPCNTAHIKKLNEIINGQQNGANSLRKVEEKETTEKQNNFGIRIVNSKEKEGQKTIFQFHTKTTEIDFPKKNKIVVTEFKQKRDYQVTYRKTSTGCKITQKDNNDDVISTFSIKKSENNNSLITVELTSKRYTIAYSSETAENFFTIVVKPLEEGSNKSTSSVAIHGETKGIELLWQSLNSYFKKNLLPQIGQQLQEGIQKEKEKEITTQFSGTLRNWFEDEGKDKLKKLLEKAKFKKDFIEFFVEKYDEEIIQSTPVKKYNFIGDIYPKNFGGDLGEVEVKAKIEFFEKQKNITSTDSFEITGTQPTDLSKQVPADGVFKYKTKDGEKKCTFQSKFLTANSLKLGLYNKSEFYLGHIDANQYNTTRYAYPQDLINEYPIRAVINNENNSQDAQNYLGALAGLLRIKTYVVTTKNSILGQCDMFYISGFFVPSIYILQYFLDQNMEILNDKNQRKKPILETSMITDENGEKNILKGVLNSLSIDTMLNQIEQNSIEKIKKGG